ncbi:MAG: cell wall-binding repeat-containing protein [Eggerthellales bacterium]|nr:cell wall-binding repeat-containing protein [Eggerthellales bacterium]
MKLALGRKRPFVFAASLALATACCFAAVGTACAADEPVSGVVGAVDRVWGNEAVDTAIAASKEAFPEGLTEGVVVLARDDDYMDSMSATGLAGAYDSPILLTNRMELSSQVLKEIKRLKAHTVFLIGGNVAVKPAVENALIRAGLTVERIFGNEASDTSVACAKMIEEKDGSRNSLDTAVVATSIDFADALSVSSFAYKYHIPIFITTSYDSEAGDRVLGAEAKAMIDGYAKVFVPGGPGALPKSSVEGVWGEEKVTRVFGMTGYDTSVAVAKKMMEDGYLPGSTVGVANGMASAKGLDALTSSALLAKNDAPLVLVEGTINTGAAVAFIAGNNNVFDNVKVFGGTYVCPNDLVEEIDDALSNTVHYVAVLGSDYWDRGASKKVVQGSDTQIIMRVDTEDATVSLLTVPRDTYYVQRGDDCRPNYPGSTCICGSSSACLGKTWYKSNYAFHYGYYQAIENGSDHTAATRAGAVKACQALSEIAKVGVTDYILCDIGTVQKVVETIGGLTVNLPYTIDWGTTKNRLYAGEQVLNGDDFNVASRERHSYAERYGLPEDATRQSVDRMLLCNLIKAALNSDEIGFDNTGDLLNMLVASGFIQTNISSERISEWGNALQQKRDSLVVQGASGPYEVERYDWPELGSNGEGSIQTVADYHEEEYVAIAKEFCSGSRMNSGYYVETWN